MEDLRKPSPYQISPDEKTVMMMFYTAEAVYRGEAVLKSGIRASVWMRTPAAPEYVHLLNAQVIKISGTQIKSLQFPEYYLPATNIIAYHITPPGEPDGFDYDEMEQNRAFEATTVLVGNFMFYGSLRIASASSAGASLLANRSAWVSLYHVEIASPSLPQMGVIKSPIVLVKANAVGFGLTYGNA